MSKGQREWASEQFLTHRFTVADVSRATELTPKDIHNYVSRNQTKVFLTSASTGKGARRLFSQADAIVLGTISRLACLGIGPATAAVIGKQIRDWALKPAQITYNQVDFRGLPETYGLFRPDNQLVFTRDLDGLGDTQIVLNVTELIQRVSRQLTSSYQLIPIRDDSDWELARKLAHKEIADDERAENEWRSAGGLITTDK